jgi:hypothetical protein
MMVLQTCKDGEQEWRQGLEVSNLLPFLFIAVLIR